MSDNLFDQKKKELGYNGTQKIIELLLRKFNSKMNAGEINESMVRKIWIGHVHEFIGEITKEATCTESGIMTYKCECGEDSYDEIIPMLDHQYEDIPEELAWNITSSSNAYYNNGYFAGWRLCNSSAQSSAKFTASIATEVTLDTATVFPLNFRTNIITSTEAFAVFVDGTNVQQLNGSSSNRNGADYNWNISIPAGTHQVAYLLSVQSGTNVGRYVNLMQSTLKYSYTNIKKQCKMCGKAYE